MAGAVKAEQRIWRTTDGALVLDGDPAAAVLAYAAGDPVAQADVDEYQRVTGAKARPAAPNKARGKPADKQA